MLIASNRTSYDAILGHSVAWILSLTMYSTYYGPGIRFSNNKHELHSPHGFRAYHAHTIRVMAYEVVALEDFHRVFGSTTG